MSGQISDSFIFKGKEYSLINMSGDGLATPEYFGMHATTMNTACYRGYVATYEITETGIFLSGFTLRELNNNYQPIGGIMPVKDDPEQTPSILDGDRVIGWSLTYKTKLGHYGCPVYSGIHITIPFTGMLRLADGLIEKYYIHMGFQKASAFKTVIDITFNKGQITTIQNRSKEMRQIRGSFKKKYDSGDYRTTIAEAFSQDMTII